MATALLEKQKVIRQKSAVTETEPTLYHWTVEALYRAINAGVFEQPELLELIQGRIIENISQNAPHASLRRRLAHQFRRSMEPSFLVMEESSLRLAPDGEPDPDVIVVLGTESDYDKRHPTQADTVLVVEVSNTTVDYDLGGKALLYSQAGISDYWVVLVNEAALVRHREPTPDGYQSVTRLSGSDSISPLAMPQVVWTVAALQGMELETNS